MSSRYKNVGEKMKSSAIPAVTISHSPADLSIGGEKLSF